MANVHENLSSFHGTYVHMTCDRLQIVFKFVLNMLEDLVSRCGHMHTMSSFMLFSFVCHEVASNTGSPGP